MKHARSLASAVGLALTALLLWRCAGSTQPAVESAPTAAASAQPAAANERLVTRADEPLGAASAPSPAAALLQASPSPSGADAPAASDAPVSGAAAISAAVARRDPRGLALLTRIERELKRDPPAAAHELVRLHEAGASRGELLRARQQLPPGEVQLRVLVQRWIDEVQPDPSRPRPQAPATPAPSTTHLPGPRPIERSAAPP